MKKNYLVTAFQKTAAQRFPEQAERLNWALEKHLAELWEENAGATPEEKFHLESQILPGIAAYQVLQTVLPREEALATLHGYVEERAWKLRKGILGLMRIPGLWRRVPGLFARGTRKFFGSAAGFAARELEVTGSVWRIDMRRNAPITTPASAMAARSSALASATATTSPTATCIPGSSGAGPRPWAGAADAAISA